MRTLLFLVLIPAAISCYGQISFQPGDAVGESPILSYLVTDSDSPSGYSEAINFVTVDNYGALGSSIILGRYDNELGFDTVQEYPIYNRITDSYEGFYVNATSMVYNRVYCAGLSHRIALPISPAMFYGIPDGMWSQIPDSSASGLFELAWEFDLPDVSYNVFNPKLISYTIENFVDLSFWPGPNGGLTVPSFIGVYNSSNSLCPSLIVARTRASIAITESVILSEIPLQHPFYINSVKEFDGQLLISGFEMNEETGLRKFAQVYQVDLESGESERTDLGFGSEHTEVLGSLVLENGSVVSLIEETDILGTWLQSKLVIDGVDLITFNSAFHPTKVVGEYWGQIRVGGEYDFQGVSKASIIDVEPVNGEMIMRGYADIPGGSSEFRYFHRSEYGKYIAGYFNGASESSSFLTRMVEGNLLSVQPVEKNQLATIRGATLVFNQGGFHQYSVIDTSGRLIQSEETTNRTVALNLPTGFYTVVVTGETDTQSVKVVVAN